jgi:hypothetical protein
LKGFFLIIGWTAKQNHVHDGFDTFTNSTAIEISQNRTYKDTGFLDFKKGRRKNTVFAKPQNYLRCKTDDPDFGDLIISRFPVRTLQCEKANSSSGWTSQELGHYHSIFDAKTGHFPGYLYKNVNFQ